MTILFFMVMTELKKDTLYRFDSKDIYKISDNFAMGNYVILKIN